METFNPLKISTIITLIMEFLEKKKEYRLHSQFTKTELVELRKHFNVEVDEFASNTYEFKKKED